MTGTTETHPPFSEYAQNLVEAKARAKIFRDKDPFKGEIPASLLSSEHIQAYVCATGMLHPFHHDKEGRLKAASYEVNPGTQFIMWNEKGHKVITENPQELVLPANSITFVQLESHIFLPNYIGMRFNLRIQHVHRGLLLGTGPLVDPGFQGNLLIPLHNLTSQPYKMSADEGLIWVEFTKTTFGSQYAGKQFHFFEIDPNKTNRAAEYYFEKANSNNPIQSSIPIVAKESLDRLRSAEKAAREARLTNQFFATVGILAIAGIVITLLTYFTQIVQFGADIKDKTSRSETSIAETVKKLDDVIHRIEALEKESTNKGSPQPNQPPLRR